MLLKKSIKRPVKQFKTQIRNLSIKLSHFPKDCKLAKLKLLYKNGTKTDHQKFRPISLLPIVPKIIDKVIKCQTMDDLTESNILYKYQSGFCKNHSTDTSLSYLTDKMVLINSQKPFDIIKHKILRLRKMTSLGFSNQSVMQLQSYLSQRSLQVNIKKQN